MRLAIALAALPVLWGAAQEGDFESPEFGIRLKLPAGWTVGSSSKPEILKLSLPGEHAFRPEIYLHNLAFTEEHITLGQYREQIRQQTQREYVEPRILDDRTVTAGGRPGFVLETAFKRGDVPAISYRGIIELSPSRLVSFLCVAPKAAEEPALKAFDGLLAAIEFFPRQPQDGADAGLKRFAAAAEKLDATPADYERKLELDYGIGERNVGSYSQSLKGATRDGAAGLEATTIDIIDLGKDGRLEKRTTAFLSDDLAKQRAEVEIIHRSREQRVQYFAASAALDGTDVTVERRVNGEKSTAKLKVAERTVFMELLEALEFRLLAGGKGPTITVPVLPVFDNEPGYVKIDHTGEHEMKSPTGSGLVKITVLAVAREDGAIITYWFDADRRMIRRSVGGQGVVLQARK
jgi:hypothetical protein